MAHDPRVVADSVAVCCSVPGGYCNIKLKDEVIYYYRYDPKSGMTMEGGRDGRGRETVKLRGAAEVRARIESLITDHLLDYVEWMNTGIGHFYTRLYWKDLETWR